MSKRILFFACLFTIVSFIICDHFLYASRLDNISREAYYAVDKLPYTDNLSQRNAEEIVKKYFKIGDGKKSIFEYANKYKFTIHESNNDGKNVVLFRKNIRSGFMGWPATLFSWNEVVVILEFKNDVLIDVEAFVNLNML